ncbi:MAG: tetratricopeptide repeat protein [Myxococcota bacterium]|nr:tetratricopeptide repeat protein [Myxococcota bacterium]
MRPAVQPTPARDLRGLALAAALLALLAAGGCREADPLAAIQQQQAAGDLVGSIEPLRELLAERPDDPELNYLYGRTLVLTQQQNLASWSLRIAMDHPDWLIPAGLQLAQLRFQNRDWNEVEEITSRILEADPENVPALLLRAGAHAHWKKDPARAIADTDRVLELDPRALAAYEPRVLALTALDRKKEAREELARVGRRLDEWGGQENVLAWHCTTTAQMQQEAEEIDAARKTWEECLEKLPTNIGVVSGAMSFHDARGESDTSLQILRDAFEAAPTSRMLRKTLSDRLLLLGRAAEAEALLREATRSPQPREAAAAWQDLAALRIRLRDYGAAAEAIEKAIELSEQVGGVPAQLEFEQADTLVVAGQHRRALLLAEHLSVPAHRHLIRARVAQERRQPARALEEFDAGLRLWPDNAYARYYAAYAAQELGDFDRALEEFRYSVRSDPAATDARRQGAGLLLAAGRPGEAREMLLAGSGKGAPLSREDQLLLARINGSLGNLKSVSVALERLARGTPAHLPPDWAGRVLAEAAEGAASRAGAAVALELLASAPAVDYTQPRFAAALRVFVQVAHQAGDTTAAQEALRAALAAHPEAGVFQEIRGLDLELAGEAAEARGAYERALEITPGNARALEGLGRLSLADDPEAALRYFDRAAAADPTDPGPDLQAARALVAAGRPGEAADRLDALLLEHAYAADAALERARLDVEAGGVTPQTLERARRAARFGGGAEAFEMLGRVHEQRGEADLAAQAADRARELRERASASAGAEAPVVSPGG